MAEAAMAGPPSVPRATGETGVRKMDQKLTRRNFLGGTGALSLGAALAACGFGVGEEQRRQGGNTATVWDVRVADEQDLMNEIIKSFNASHDNMRVAVQWFENDPFKNKLRVSMGAGNPPDIFFGWGGGVLGSQVEAGKVYALGKDVDTSKYLTSVMEPVTIDGTVYGIPNTGTQPVVFYYNKPIFEDNGLEPPRTWSETLDAVRKLRRAGVDPISLAGKNQWPGLMYLEYFVDRLGGPEVFNRVVQQEAGAYSDPAFLEANRLIQELARLKAFPAGFTSLNYDTEQSTQLIYNNKAAMHLMGSWDFARFSSNAEEFLDAGNLGWFTFPEVEGGKGDPANVVGNPTSYFSISEASKTKNVAATFLSEAMLSDQYLDGLINIGLVPPLNGIEQRLSGTEYSDWLTFVFNLAKDAPAFTQSWDQALSPEQAQELLTNLDLVFLLDITPQEFSNRMNKTIGQ
ncbi:MAG: extracellular solute-binding protein [Streptosporangiales bacterium]|nr:extracellular solute-binding protein [Streptosporangiales bacterium]